MLARSTDGLTRAEQNAEPVQAETKKAALNDR